MRGEQYDVYLDGGWIGYRISGSAKSAASEMIRAVNLTTGTVTVYRTDNGRLAYTIEARDAVKYARPEGERK